MDAASRHDFHPKIQFVQFYALELSLTVQIFARFTWWHYQLLGLGYCVESLGSVMQFEGSIEWRITVTYKLACEETGNWSSRWPCKRRRNSTSQCAFLSEPRTNSVPRRTDKVEAAIVRNSSFPELWTADIFYVSDSFELPAQEVSLQLETGKRKSFEFMRLHHGRMMGTLWRD